MASNQKNSGQNDKESDHSEKFHNGLNQAGPSTATGRGNKNILPTRTGDGESLVSLSVYFSFLAKKLNPNW